MSSIDRAHWLQVTRAAAAVASEFITAASHEREHLVWEEKSATDFVSRVDLGAEERIRAHFAAHAPDVRIVGEELGGGSTHEGLVAIVDPLDGTTNFLHGFPVYAVSIAMSHKGVLTQGVVYDPVRNDLFTATRGAGAFLNDRRIRVSKRDKLIDCLVATGFPFRMFDHTDAYIAMMRDFMRKTAGIRRPGAAALDLANVAAGRMDGFWEIGLSPWDMAAGVLLVQEAGGLVGDLQGNDGYMTSGNIVAASPRIFPQMLEVIRGHLTEPLRAS